jgi:hypothetical protein
VSDGIQVGAAVRSRVSRRLGKVMQPRRRLAPWKVLVLFDGMERAVPIDTDDVSLVGANYAAVKAREAEYV